MLTTYEIVLTFLSVIGLWAIFCWLVDNLKSITQIIIAILAPYFQPNEQKSLSERFGSWAGEKKL